MKHHKIFFSLLVVLLIASCQPANPADPDTDQASPGTPTPEAPTLVLEVLQDALTAEGAFVTVDSPVEQPFFSVPGQVILVNGEAVQVFEYRDPSIASAEAAQVSADGSTIGSTMASWTGSPHFFRDEQLIVIYVGENLEIIGLLESVLGPQFAGVSPQGPNLETQPPPAVLRIGDDEQISGIGSYCWPDLEAGLDLCVDMVGLPTDPEPLKVLSPFTAQLSMPLPDAPDTLALTVIPVSSEDQMPTEIDGMRWWPPKPGEQFGFPLIPSHELELTLAPGKYVFDIFAQWEDFGDVTYAFLVDVLPPDESEISPRSTSTVVILAEAGLNLRESPDLNAEVINIARQNEFVEVVGTSEDKAWFEVLCRIGSCWMSADPRWSAPVDLGELSLAGLIYFSIDQQPERPLWRIAADGEPILVVEDSQNLGSLSPDLSQAIRWNPPRGETDLILTNLASGQERLLTDTPDRYNFNPQWWEANPDQVVFISRQFKPSDLPMPGPGNLATVKTDGTGFEILDEEHLTYSYLPTLAPDGQTIAYTHGSEGPSEDKIFAPWLYQLEEGSQPFNYSEYGLENLPGLTFGSAAWSPDGNYLAWIIGGELTGDGEWKLGIALFDLVQKSVEIIEPISPANCTTVWCTSAPSWSPDSQWLAWDLGSAGELPSFWVMRPDRSEKTLFDYAASPFWSPDSSWLVFIQVNTGSLLVMEAGKWDPRPTGLPGRIGVHAWLPDE